MQNNNVITIKSRSHDTVDINNDYILPDYINDVRKLVRCDSRVIIHNSYSNDKQYTLEGEVLYAILVICEDDSIKNIIYSEDFSVSCPLLDTGEVSVYYCDLLNLSARLISPRKLNCRSRICVISKENIIENAKPHYNGDGSTDAEFTVQMQQEKAHCISTEDIRVTNQHASHDIEISTDKEEISSIVYCNITTSINEQKVTDGKLILRGESIAEILYETVNSSYRKITNKFPFSDIVNDEKNADGYICDVVVNDVKATVRNNTFGEMRLIELDYTYDIICHTYTEQTTDLVTDLYSTEYDVVCQYKDVTHHELNRIFSSSLSVNDTKIIDDICDEGISSIIDCNASVVSFDVSCDHENKRTLINGDIKFDIVCSGERNHYVSLTIPYRYEREYDGKTNNVMSDYTVKVLTANASLEKGKILIGCELYFSVMLAEEVISRCISEVEFTSCGSSDNSPIIVYYPRVGECLWDIAKKFKSTCQDIKSVNSLSDDSLEGIKVLLLPKRKQKSIMNRII